MIKLSQTYEIVTQKSAENGEAAERGFDWEDCEHGFRETVEVIKSGGFTFPSDSNDVPRWLSTEADHNMYSGDYETKSLHPGRDPKSQKYWAKACKAAGF